MKMREAHVVPLSKQAIEILRELQPLTGRGRVPPSEPVFGAGTRIRTGDLPLTRRLLYQLSYAGMDVWNARDRYGGCGGRREGGHGRLHRDARPAF